MTDILCVILKADSRIGTGHLMRVKGLLAPLKEAGLSPVLVTDSLSDELEPLASDYAKIIRAAPSDEALAKAACALSPKLTLIDHYFFAKKLESLIKKGCGCKIAVIEDLHRRHECDLLTDSGIFTSPESYDSLVPARCLRLVGPQYSLIREEFVLARRNTWHERRRVLINYGGADPAHACLKALRAVIAGRLFEDYDFTLLTGISNPDHEELLKLAAPCPQIEVLRHTAEVAKLFSRCDYALGACGGMFKERLCSGLVSACTEIASNQAGGIEALKKLGCGTGIALEDLDKPAAVRLALDDLRAHEDEYRENGIRAFDGRGIGRVAAGILSLL
ncbi:MAG: UDP-2,4-diacetamido-2,4,6-trideoxy-beta-L-altropyranose hydrolase [Succinivibrio sp.]|nr:UDP-2,4-diacetamido-2,4,6-trideoxy-beta-L-altropyranose hydrolase [Succinivibrio sp.]